MRSLLRVPVLIFVLWAAMVHARAYASGEEVDCIACHGALIDGMKAHAAVSMGCPSCHAGIDAREVPHRTTTKARRGLTVDPPQLCYTCHDRKRFINKKVHPALDGGCGSCHDPHGSGNNRLLTRPVPELCDGCHDLALSSKKHGHGPAAAGACLQCHDPHASGNNFLLTKPGAELCTRCHDGAMLARKIKHGPSAAEFCVQCHMPHGSPYRFLLVAPPPWLCGTCHTSWKEIHLISGLRMKGHPVGAGKQGGERKKFEDPVRKGRRFSCVSCHDPHSSESIYMIRFSERSSTDICANCHIGKN